MSTMITKKRNLTYCLCPQQVLEQSFYYLHAIALSRGGKLGEAGGLSGLEGKRFKCFRSASIGCSSFWTVMLCRKSDAKKHKDRTFIQLTTQQTSFS